MERVALMGYGNMPHQERERRGVTDNLVRLPLGVEDAADLVADLRQARR